MGIQCPLTMTACPHTQSVYSNNLIFFNLPLRKCPPGSMDVQREMPKRLRVSRNIVVFKLDLNNQ